MITGICQGNMLKYILRNIEEKNVKFVFLHFIVCHVMGVFWVG